MLKVKQLDVVQRLQQFYKSLRVVEDTWVESFDRKPGAFVEHDAGLSELEHSSVSSTSISAPERTDCKKNRSQGHKRKPSGDASKLEQLCRPLVPNPHIFVLLTHNVKGYY